MPKLNDLYSMTVIPFLSRNDSNSNHFVDTKNTKTHPVSSSIQHWQLRDLVLCPFNNRDLFVVNKGNVVKYNAYSKKRVEPCIKNISFEPCSLAVSHDFIAVGGQKGQVSTKNLLTNCSGQINTGGSINNGLEIFSHFSNDLRLLVCNNDQTVKIYSLPNLQKIDQLHYPISVNKSCISPDGKKMIVVGDNDLVFLHEINPSSSYNVMATLSCSESSFSCSWNEYSDKFAIACQDGSIYIWDIRSSQKLATIPSFQSHRERNACRKVLFTRKNSIDLLLFSEHKSFINIVDARLFDQRQSIFVSSVLEDDDSLGYCSCELQNKDISGFDVSPDNKYLYVGLESCIVEYSIDIAVRRMFSTGSLC